MDVRANMSRSFAAFLVGLASALTAPLIYAQALKDCTRLSLPVERVVSRPSAYDEFCLSHPGHCDMTGSTVIELNTARLQVIEKIHRDVNAEFRFIDDLEWRGKEDEWSYPVLGAGDCEDFALEKRRRLVEQGLPRAAMSMSIVYHKEFKSPHAILLLETTEGTVALNNPNNEILCWDKAPYNYETRERPDGRWDRFDQSFWK